MTSLKVVLCGKSIPYRTHGKKEEAARSQSPLPSPGLSSPRLSFPPLSSPFLSFAATRRLTRQEQNRSSLLLLSLRENKVDLPSSGISSISASSGQPLALGSDPPSPLALGGLGAALLRHLSYLHWGYILGATI